MQKYEDRVRTLATYADVIIIQHPEIDAVQRAANVSCVPVINAGDGTGEHPTQVLLDMFTIQEEIGTTNGLTVIFLFLIINIFIVFLLKQRLR